MPISNWALERFVSPRAAGLVRNGIHSLPDSASKRDDWLANFILNSMFRVAMPDVTRALYFSAIFRIQASCYEYDATSFALSKYCERDRSSIDDLFAALRHAEQWALQTYQAYMLIRSILGEGELFKKGDTSPLARLNEIQNASKHACERLANGTGEYTTAVWLSSDGIECSAATLSYAEMHRLVDDLAHVAVQLSNPQAASSCGST